MYLYGVFIFQLSLGFMECYFCLPKATHTTTKVYNRRHQCYYAGEANHSDLPKEATMPRCLCVSNAIVKERLDVRVRTHLPLTVVDAISNMIHAEGTILHTIIYNR